MDLICTTASLLLPFICFDIYEASFRFARGGEYDEKMVISSTLGICTIETGILLIFYCCIAIIFDLPVIGLVCLISAVIEAYYQVLSQYARGKCEMKTFALAGVINSIFLLALNVLLMIVLVLGLVGWIYSFLLAKLFAILYLAIKLKIWKHFSLSSFDRKFVKEAINYCIPLIPSTSMWWVMNASNRYIISFFAGVSATGIYAVGNKMPSLLSIFENVFYQAWQTTAISIADNKDRDKIYSEIFLNYFKFLVVGAMGILVILKPLIYACFSKEYHSAWICSSVLLIGVMIHALAGNLGTIYTVFKSTGGALKTSAAGACSNALLTVLLVKIYGMNAAAWATLIGYLVVLLFRWRDTKKFVYLSIPKKQIYLYSFFLIIQLILYYFSSMESYVLRSIIFLIFLFINRNMIKRVLIKK